MQAKKQQLELDMEQQTGSKSGKEYIKAMYCHLAYLTYMQSTSCEMLEIAHTQKLKQQNFIVSQFWKLEVQDQSAVRVGFCGGSLLGL